LIDARGLRCCVRYEVLDTGYAARVRGSFARQGLMQTLGARLVDIEPGRVTIEMDRTSPISQQQGVAHAGAVAAIMDTAAGYSALTLTPAGTEIVSVEFKVNMLEPAGGDRIVARAQVVRPGRRVTVCSAEAYAVADGAELLVATMLATMAPIATPGE